MKVSKTIKLLSACIVGASFFAPTRSTADDVLFQTFSSSDADPFEQSYDPRNRQPRASLAGRIDIGAMRDVLTDYLPAGTQFVRDIRGVGSMAMDRRARFLSVKAPVMGDERTGMYVTFGVGRDRDMKDASDRNFATKMVAGARLGLGRSMETFIEYRQVRGIDFTGVSAPEHQTSIGLSIKF